MRQRIQQIFAVIIGWLHIVNCQIIFEGNPCPLPSGKTGQCVNLLKCPEALAKVRQGYYPNICTFFDNISVVCCENLELNKLRLKPEKPGDVSAKKCHDYASKDFQFVASLEKDREEKCFLIENLLQAPPKLPKNSTQQKFPRNSTDNTESYHYDWKYLIGGVNADLGQYPHVVAIGYGSEPDIQWRCTGSLISEEWILTAAHCNAAPTLGVASWALLGTIELNDPYLKFQIEKRIKHPSYIRNAYYHDIALMKLKRPVTFSFALRPACLRVEPNIKEQTTIAAGWGVVDWRTQQTSNILQTVYLDLYNKSICDNVFEGDPRLASGMSEDNQLCIGALEGGRDTCNGDSGGGVLEINSKEKCMFDIVGVTSVGSRFCGTSNSAGLYTKVANYLDWIERIVWPEFFI